MLRMGMCHYLGGIVDRARRHSSLQQLIAQRGAVNLHQPGFELGFQIGAVSHPVDVLQEARVVCQLRAPQQLAQFRKCRVIASADEDVHAAGAKGVIGTDIGMGVAGGHWHLARQPVIDDVRVHQRDSAVIQGHVDELAQAGAFTLRQRHQNGHGRIQPGAHVHHGHAQSRRIAASLAIDAEPPRHGLHDGVVARIAAQRTIGAKAADPAVYQARKPRPQNLLIPKAPLLHGTWLEVLQQDVGALEQTQQHLARLGLRQIQPEGTLVAVDTDVVGGIAIVERRAPVPGFIAARRFDLEYFGAVIGQHLGTIRPAQHPGQVDDLLATEGTACG